MRGDRGQPTVHHDYRALTQFGGLDLIDERIEQREGVAR